jgi:hypothetical protein
MRSTQIYTNGILTNYKPFSVTHSIWHKVSKERLKEAFERSEIITFTIELITLASLIFILVLLAAVLQ